MSGINVIKLDFSSSLTAVQNKLERLSLTENLKGNLHELGTNTLAYFAAVSSLKKKKKVSNINAWGICYKYCTGPLI